MKPTREQVLAESAGRQLDAWIAEWVMGLAVRKTIEINGWGEFTNSRNWAQLGDYVYSMEHGNVEIIPYYSTDIAAAWQVVEKMREKLYGFIVEDGSYPRDWDASFHPDGDPLLQISGQADTAPLAICRASLLAVIGDEL